MPNKDRAEEHYLDSIEAEQEGDFEQALSSARKAIDSDPEHLEAWWMISSLELPRKTSPNLKQAAKCLEACRRVVTLNPEHNEAWIRGGRLHEEMGLYEDALEWWQQWRFIVPDAVEPIVEQTAILVDLGMYNKAMQHLGTIVAQDLVIPPNQMTRLSRLYGMVEKAAKQETASHFKPWEKRHSGWESIRMRKDKAPVSETYLFLLAVVPFLVIEVYLSRGLSAAGWSGFCFSSLIILLTVMLGVRFTRKIFYQVNRPAFNMVRAMDMETSSGYKMIPSELRLGRMYLSILGKRPLAYQERLLAIIEKGDDLPRGWKPKIPDLSQPYETEDDEVIAEEGKIIVDSLEEE